MKKFQITPGDILFLIPVLILLSLRLFYDVRFIETGSMEPTIHTGALVIVNPRLSVEKDDIAMYQMGSGYVVHRIIDTTESGYIFKGDNNEDPDPNNPVSKDDVIGPVVIKINFVAPLVRKITGT